MQEKILRTRLHFCGSHATLNLMNALCRSYCLRLPCLSQYTVLYMQKLYIQNCNRVLEPTRPLCNSLLNVFIFKLSLFYPKLSFGHVSCHTALKLSLCKQSLPIICSVFDLLKVFFFFTTL